MNEPIVKVIGLAERIDRVLEERLPDLDIETGKAIHEAIAKNADDLWKELKFFVENFPLDSDFDRENRMTGAILLKQKMLAYLNSLDQHPKVNTP